MIEKIKKQYSYYRSNESALLERYRNQCIVISDALVVTAFPDRLQAYTFGVQNYGLGNFLMHECKEGGMSTINTFSSLPYKI